MKMNILFIYSCNIPVSFKKPLRTFGEMHFGISYISALLKQHGFNTDLLILSSYYKRQNNKIINDFINKFNPKLICFTAVTSEYPFIKEVAKYIKQKYPDIFLLIGGTHATLMPDEVILDDFDALCVAEGEFPTLELANQLNEGTLPANIPNLWIKQDDIIKKNEPRPFQENLDMFPYPDREMWLKWINDTKEHEEYLNILLGRGCPFSCTYCSNHALRKITSGTYVRFRSPENIIEELNDIRRKYPNINSIYFEIETITANKEWLEDFTTKLKDFNASINNLFSYRVNFRVVPKMDFEHIFSLLQSCNFKHINIGLESGSERVRREILNRNYSNDDIINAVKIARKYDLKVSFYNLIGLPGETEEDFKETIRINRICQPDNHFTSIFFPYPGTILYEKCEERGLLKDINFKMERLVPALNLPEFPASRIHANLVWFDYNVYKGFKPLHKVIYSTVKNFIKTNPFTYSISRSLIVFLSSFSSKHNYLRIFKLLYRSIILTI